MDADIIIKSVFRRSVRHFNSWNSLYRSTRNDGRWSTIAVSHWYIFWHDLTTLRIETICNRPDCGEVYSLKRSYCLSFAWLPSVSDCRPPKLWCIRFAECPPEKKIEHNGQNNDIIWCHNAIMVGAQYNTKICANIGTIGVWVWVVTHI